MKRINASPLRLGKKGKNSLSNGFQYHTGGNSNRQAISQPKKKKKKKRRSERGKQGRKRKNEQKNGHPDWKGKKTILFTDNMTGYTGNPKECTKIQKTTRTNNRYIHQGDRIKVQYIKINCISMYQLEQLKAEIF